MMTRIFTVFCAVMAVASVVLAVQDLQAGEPWVDTTLGAVMFAALTAMGASWWRRDNAKQADADDGEAQR